MLSKFLKKWNPKKGENHKINYQSLSSDVTDETLTHYYIAPELINVDPSAVAESNELKPSLISLPPDVRNSQVFFTDRFYLNIEQNKFSKKVCIYTFYLDEMEADITFDDFINQKKKPTLSFSLSESQIFLPFLLKNDSLLVYSTRKAELDDYDLDDFPSSDSSSSSIDKLAMPNSDKLKNESADNSEIFNIGESEAFISLNLFEYKHFTESEIININIGQNVLSQIIPDSLPGNLNNISLFDYRQEKDEEVINSNASDHIFKQIIPDPLSCDRFFFLAYKALYLAEIIGTGQKRHLEIFKIYSDKPILKYDVSETAIVYLTVNEEGYYIFESFSRTDNIVIKKINIMSDRLYATKPDLFFLYNKSVFIKPHNSVACIWNLESKKVDDVDPEINFYVPASKDCICIIYNDNKIVAKNGSTSIDCDTKYVDEIKILANSSFLLLIDNYEVKQIPLNPKKKKPSKSLFSFDDCLNSIRSVIDYQNKNFDESIASMNQMSDEIIDRIKKITEKLSSSQ